MERGRKTLSPKTHEILIITCLSSAPLPLPQRLHYLLIWVKCQLYFGIPVTEKVLKIMIIHVIEIIIPRGRKWFTLGNPIVTKIFSWCILSMELASPIPVNISFYSRAMYFDPSVDQYNNTFFSRKRREYGHTIAQI